MKNRAAIAEAAATRPVASGRDSCHDGPHVLTAGHDRVAALTSINSGLKVVESSSVLCAESAATDSEMARAAEPGTCNN